MNSSEGVMRELEIKYYDQKALRTDNSTQDEIRRCRKTIELIPVDVTSVLDIGCGNGFITNRINKPFVLGLDFSRNSLKQVKTDSVQGSIEALPIKSKTFDLIILTEVLEHLDDEAYKEAIAEIKRLCSPYLIITVPFDENTRIDYCKCSCCGNLFNVNHHYRTFGSNWFKNEFPEYALVRIEYAKLLTSPNEKLTRLKQKLGIYLYSDVAMCNICGGDPMVPNRTLKYLFSGLGIIDHIIKKIFKIQKPYHMMILLKRL